MNNITLYPIKTKLIEYKDDLAEIFLSVLRDENVTLQSNDVLVLAETPTAIAQGRFIKLDDITPSKEALKLAAQYQIQSSMAQVIIQESDKIYGGVPHALLCEKNGYLCENAGVDESNAPEGYVVLSPTFEYINNLRLSIQKQTDKKIGLIVTDSRTTPLKRGVTGTATIVSGMEAIHDERGKEDLYGRKLKMTFRAIADDLAAAAQLLIGESSELIPAVLIRGASIILSEKMQYDSKMPTNECVWMQAFLK